MSDKYYVPDGPDDADNESSSPCQYISADTPGATDNLYISDILDVQMNFEFEIIDSCNHDKVVALKTGWIYIEGSYPRKILHGGFDND